MSKKNDKCMLFFKFWLRDMLEQKGVSRDEFADGIKVSRTTAFNYLKGSPPPLDTAVRIANFLGVEVGEMVGEEPEHSVEECYRRVGEALKAKKVGGNQESLQQEEDPRIKLLDSVLEMTSALSPEERDNFLEDLAKRIGRRKE